MSDRTVHTFTGRDILITMWEDTPDDGDHDADDTQHRLVWERQLGEPDLAEYAR
jgi:hypothetical protein